ncbi:hypothetical protein OHT20_19205 [Streptomyces caniferus]|uniref:Uncharacterized protein n=1 Tax=Streptomyces caniferus TaxID=285557 RepID=A0ABZ1VLW3_9ACTN|nr:hypothetical protein [Streptomyces caniferus]
MPRHAELPSAAAADGRPMPPRWLPVTVPADVVVAGVAAAVVVAPREAVAAAAVVAAAGPPRSV